MKCRFCSDDAFDICRVPVTAPAIVEPHDLRPDDLVQSPRDLEFKQIIRIEGPEKIVARDWWDTLIAQAWPRPYRVTVRGVHKETLDLTPTLPALRLETFECETPVCECHALDRGDGRPVCCYHWEIKIDTIETQPTPPAEAQPSEVPA